jgi:hypothetical protein
VPAFLGNELWNNDRNLVVGFSRFTLNSIYKFGQRINDTSIRRVQCDQSYIRLPLLPLLFKLHFIFSFKWDIYSNNLLWGNRFGVCQLVFNYMSNAGDRENDYISLNRYSRVTCCKSKLITNCLIMLSNTVKQIND